ncbi:phospholipid transport system substrate-binding protein [Neisseria sp. HSC-16F19]|nr:ABC transporter substrate-binding protein [Neisseria sp. HSC-16F19]MCP2040367.1 phospholipid transport system substrate-binding protein [Neisseria sp. HSC-16F19]
MKKSAFFSAAAIGVMSISLAWATPQQAVGQIRTNADQVLAILNKAKSPNDAQVRREAENYAIPYFDFERLTARAVGAPWRQATAAQKQALSAEFKTLLIRTYSGTMMSFKNAKVNVRDNAQVKGKDVVVRAEVTPPGGKAVMMDYTLNKGAKNYRVVDVAVEGQSLVTAYRGQFGQIIQQKGFDGLIADLKAKNSK